MESQRQLGDKTTWETRYYLLSLPIDAKRLLKHCEVIGALRINCIEFWMLSFAEDHSRSTLGYSGENLAVLRHLTLNLLTQEKSAKGGTRAKRLKAGWDDHYLLKVLSQSSNPVAKT